MSETVILPHDVDDVREGVWRGDPNRPVVLIDTPGLCADEEDDAEADSRIVLEIVNILKKFGHINAFILVLKSGQSRYVGRGSNLENNTNSF